MVKWTNHINLPVHLLERGGNENRGETAWMITRKPVNFPESVGLLLSNYVGKKPGSLHCAEIGCTTHIISTNDISSKLILSINVLQKKKICVLY